MLNIALRDKIAHPEFRLIYDSRMAASHPTFKSELSRAIKNIRVKYMAKDADKLFEKAKIYNTPGAWYNSKVAELAKVIYNDKGISNEFIGRWRSIEFELIFKSDATENLFAKEARSAGLGKFVTIKNDPSIQRNERDSNGVPREVVCSYKSGDEHIVEKFCQLLKGKAYVNSSCGTHVHFDMRQANVEAAMLYGNRLARCVPALIGLLPKSRRNSKYCASVISTINGNRYSFVNMTAYQKYKTIEVRAHSGTINAEKILNWIELCAKIMSTDTNFLSATKPGPVNTIDELIAQYNFTGSTAEYIENRYKQFNKAIGAKDTEGEEAIAQAQVNAPVAAA